MSPTLQSLLMAAGAAAITAAVEAVANGTSNWKSIAINATTAALMVVAAFLKQSPVSPSSPAFDHEKPEKKP